MFTRPQGVALENLSQQARGTGLASRLAGPAARSITKTVIQMGSKLSPRPKTATLGASLIGILSGRRLSGRRLRFPTCRSLAGSPNARERAPSQAVLGMQSWTLHRACPRAPPI